MTASISIQRQPREPVDDRRPAQRAEALRNFDRFWIHLRDRRLQLEMREISPLTPDQARGGNVGSVTQNGDVGEPYVPLLPTVFQRCCENTEFESLHRHNRQ